MNLIIIIVILRQTLSHLEDIAFKRKHSIGTETKFEMQKKISKRSLALNTKGKNIPVVQPARLIFQ